MSDSINNNIKKMVDNNNSNQLVKKSKINKDKILY